MNKNLIQASWYEEVRMRKFRVELWRFVKYMAITLGLSLIFTVLDVKLINAADTSNWSSQVLDIFMSLWMIASIIVPSCILALIHQYFTFRATEKWYIAVSLMIVTSLIWILFEIVLMVNMPLLTMSILVVASYFVQRHVIYLDTTDTNGWYRRFHPTNDEKGD